MSVDQPSAKFDMYAAQPASGDWNYILDDTGIQYRRGLVAFRLRPGQWPFAYADPQFEHKMRRDRRFPVPPECGVASVRLAPDVAYRAWSSEYVLVWPSHTVPHHATANLNLRVRAQGMGGMTVRCDVHLDLLNGTHRIEGLPPDVPEEVKRQAECKAAKLTAYFAAEVANRDGDRKRPLTAWEHAEQLRHRPGQWREPSPAHGSPGWSREVGDGERWLFVTQRADGRWVWMVCRHNATATDASGDTADRAAAMEAADTAAKTGNP